MNIKDAQKLVDEWIKEHGVRYFNELTNMAILSEEVGEVAKIIARKYGEQSLKENDNIDDLCLLYTSPSPRDNPASRMPSSA